MEFRITVKGPRQLPNRIRRDRMRRISLEFVVVIVCSHVGLLASMHVGQSSANLRATESVNSSPCPIHAARRILPKIANNSCMLLGKPSEN